MTANCPEPAKLVSSETPDGELVCHFCGNAWCTQWKKFWLLVNAAICITVGREIPWYRHRIYGRIVLDDEAVKAARWRTGCWVKELR